MLLELCQVDGAWFFIDETGVRRDPYPSENEAQLALVEYRMDLLIYEPNKEE